LLLISVRFLKTKRSLLKTLQGGQDLNLQPAVLETAALPIEPPPYVPDQIVPDQIVPDQIVPDQIWPNQVGRNRQASSPKFDSGHAKAWQISTTGISVRHGPGPKKFPSIARHSLGRASSLPISKGQPPEAK
jgi:hypothetical protein